MTERRKIIFSIVCIISGLFLIAMIGVASFNVVSLSTYDEKTEQLYQCKRDYRYLETELSKDEPDWDEMYEEEVTP